MCKISLQYVERPDERFGVQVGMQNRGILSGKGEDICEELRKRMIDVCCLQELRWKGQCARMLGIKGRRYKLCWSEKGDGIGGVGAMVKEEMCEKVVEIRMVNDSDDSCCCF